MTRPGSAARIKAQAAALGFNLVGITPAAPSPHLLALFDWLAAGYHGAMEYLARPYRLARHRDLNVLLPGARALVLVGLDYHALRLPPEALNDPARGRIATYAWGADYHRLMTQRLKALGLWLKAEAGPESFSKPCVDTSALLERSHAQQAGLGFTGKNTLLIHPRRGSDFFLGVLATTLAFDEYDQPGAASLCGRCARCLTACPTAAFPRPYVLDARRCISYLTIEHPGWLDRALRPLMGNWVFGCDVCQEVCPWQRFAIQTQETAFYPGEVERAAPLLADLLALTPERFAERFAGSALARAGRDQLVRNACVATANGGQHALAPQLAALLRDPAPPVRGHAGWALARLQGPAAAPALEATLAVESDPAAAEDLRQTLAELAIIQL
ncbi:MAG: tRNA epoxyqueuosine(34) reductase QueG [Anaerolineales bacterium]|nr:tRNA epoxyqueuosine(34) reductase QueG [Anaerolineales bacterium]